ncbi:NADPH-dependent 2,4-dienoyl-CoA reductase/sulfur reductase-like enzyme [Amycolatopsis bartoniae]|uniref:Oxidase n=1 Tax=Amycolatopsis bartoniae TaxID=941986 RepID=A0A8H9MC80_9PSEU|nr:NAD(P)/FAD-dependent oxidoreductase [Amycolatopsis bartoniae]MBB2937025.1 NADPH-dependent 2,4-dienoyl-CoA reductase/sulfur reductase-like enzyme [Amycolatopsis bartoniae]TVT01034.1 FAD-dependent oxidoreductase [Amycolatopsis bartoniae]GHF51910.1 oxidase [Amycolatopsis bartoniae]
MPTSPADVAVLGAGPAGLAAAAAASHVGARVVLLDAGQRVGGQFWRHRDGDSGAGHHHWRELERLRAAVPEFLAGRQVWHVERRDDGFTLHTSQGEVTARTLVVATGAYDRQLPFPGWTLPGVFTAGGAQALLKGQGVTAGRRVVVAGTGPFLLPVAAGLAEAGAEVAGVYEAGSPAGFARHPREALAKAGEGAEYARTLLKHRIPYRTHSTVVAAHGTGAVEGAIIASLDASWRITGTREVACDAVAVGYGFTPQLEIPLQLGCATRLDVDGSLVAQADEQQRASVPGVYLAGEVCGVGGAELSLVEGELAGLHAAFTTVGAVPDDTRVARLLHKRRRARAFARVLHQTHPVRPGWQTWLTDDTLVCRCEEVPASRIRQSIVDLGAIDARAVKLLARPGMGLCQGRVCGYATACLTAGHQRRDVTAQDLLGLAARPSANPVPLGTVAQPETVEGS